jgi:hypothetical protein
MSSAVARRVGRIEPRLVVGAYVALFVGPLVVSMTRHDFWSSAFPSIVVVIAAGLLVALVARRTWAWRLLVFFDGLALLVTIVDFAGVGWVLLAAANVALLLSPQMRGWVAPAHRAGRRDHPVNDDVAAR